MSVCKNRTEDHSGRSTLNVVVSLVVVEEIEPHHVATHFAELTYLDVQQMTTKITCEQYATAAERITYWLRCCLRRKLCFGVRLPHSPVVTSVDDDGIVATFDGSNVIIFVFGNLKHGIMLVAQLLERQ